MAHRKQPDGFLGFDGARPMDGVTHFEGKVRETKRLTWSPDGQWLDVTAKGALANALTYDRRWKYVREGTGLGLVGTWRNIETNARGLDGYVFTEDSSARGHLVDSRRATNRHRALRRLGYAGGRPQRASRDHTRHAKYRAPEIRLCGEGKG